VGAPIDGYERPVCLLTEPAAQALAAVQRDLRAAGLGLRVYDCYRPQRAVDHFLRWAADLGDQRTKATFYPRVAKQELIARGYIAERSGHSRGSTVDVTLVGADGAPLEMGTPFDLFDERSHTDSQEVPDAARANRAKLRAAMERRGFRNLAVEWWHYTLEGEPYPERRFDTPVR
jgi:D-alanyl-D-alanine dipeptidase